MNSLRRTTVAGLVAVLGACSAVGLTACSEDDVTGDDAREVEISVTERDLSPARVQVNAGEIEFVVRNDGDRVHAFAVETADGVKRTENIEPGETGRVSVDLSAGRYRMYDPRGGYRLRGVSGTVVVRADDRDTDTVTERTVERTVVEEAPDEDLPEIDDPEVQEPEAQQPPAAPPPPPPPARPPTVTQTVPADPPAAEPVP